ncbi:unnamed protein product [Dicrocoelium dendriticum]|nr:unnamed protein product [Dicrocoelium dendriticum]
MLEMFPNSIVEWCDWFQLRPPAIPCTAAKHKYEVLLYRCPWQLFSQLWVERSRVQSSSARSTRWPAI